MREKNNLYFKAGYQIVHFIHDEIFLGTPTHSKIPQMANCETPLFLPQFSIGEHYTYSIINLKLYINRTSYY